jgi:MoaA/NifB/PqqE/SkfB family radical SAM enzyme
MVFDEREGGLDMTYPKMTEYETPLGRVRIVETQNLKSAYSDFYRYYFNKVTGHFIRFGKTWDDDPTWSPAGPEILDIEISTDGCPNACPWCYKGNTNGPPTNMAFETFKSILDKFPRTLTQIAFGITGVKTNPDFFKMMEYARQEGIVPNFTLSGIDLDDESAKRCASLVGAVAVSAYKDDKNACYDTVKKFVDLGIVQTNIHLMVSNQTMDFVKEVLKDRLTDKRLKGMNAIVFLGVKPKGRAASGYSLLADYSELIAFCLKNGIGFGFDSCSAPKFNAWVAKSGLPDDCKKELISISEPCESSLFSSYVNVLGEYWHCSFSENELGQSCINVLDAKDFLKDVWWSPEVERFRKKVQDSRANDCGNCHVYPQIRA